MGRHKRLTAFLIVLLLVSAFVAVPHHHDDTGRLRDCPLCLVNHHQHAASHAPIACGCIPFIAKTIPAVPAPIIAEQYFISLLNGRAPPA